MRQQEPLSTFHAPASVPFLPRASDARDRKRTSPATCCRSGNAGTICCPRGRDHGMGAERSARTGHVHEGQLEQVTCRNANVWLSTVTTEEPACVGSLRS